MSKNTRKITLMAILTAVALIIFIIEALIPIPVPVPGVKLGLANAVTLFALFSNKKLTTLNVLAILLCRILLGAIYIGRPIAILYSLAGGLLAFAAQVVMKKFVSEKQIWVCGAVGAVFHNIGQISAAVLITGTPAIVIYLPVLMVAGIFTGVLTGIIAQFSLTRIKQQDTT